MSVYTGYEPARMCTGSATPGARALMSWYLGAYAASGGRNLGIYGCKRIAGSTVLSLHGEGRACDLGVPVGVGWAQTLADALVTHSGELGMQLVIYNRRVWSGRHPHAGWRPYSGSNPHVDHLHVELSRAAAERLTAARIQDQLAARPSAPPFSGRVLVYRHDRPIMRGDDVRQWQAQMRLRGWRIEVDGVYGPESADVARRFQADKQLPVDGEVGPQTWAAAWTLPIT